MARDITELPTRGFSAPVAFSGLLIFNKLHTPAPTVSFVIGNALEYFCQNDAAQCEVFVFNDELLQRGYMPPITTRENMDLNTGVNENH